MGNVEQFILCLQLRWILHRPGHVGGWCQAPVCAAVSQNGSQEGAAMPAILQAVTTALKAGKPHSQKPNRTHWIILNGSILFHKYIFTNLVGGGGYNSLSKCRNREKCPPEHLSLMTKCTILKSSVDPWVGYVCIHTGVMAEMWCPLNGQEFCHCFQLFIFPEE